jgi:hypothetical protein
MGNDFKSHQSGNCTGGRHCQQICQISGALIGQKLNFVHACGQRTCSSRERTVLHKAVIKDIKAENNLALLSPGYSEKRGLHASFGKNLGMIDRHMDVVECKFIFISKNPTHHCNEFGSPTQNQKKELIFFFH